MLNEKNLLWSIPQLNRKAAPGVDAVDWTAFEADLDENVSKTLLFYLLFEQAAGDPMRRGAIGTIGDVTGLQHPVHHASFRNL